MNNLRIYFKFIRIAMKSRMQYRADFIVGMIALVVINIITLGTLSAVVSRFTNLHGWNVWEIIFLYNLFLVAQSLFTLFFYTFTTMESLINKGTFDQFLTRPLSPLVQLVGREVHYLGIGDMLVGVSGLVLAYVRLDLHWDWLHLTYFLLTVLSGAAIITSIFWMFACISFWTGRSESTFWVIWEVSTMVQQYPIDIFGRWFRILVTAVIPMAFMNFYPALFLLDKPTSALGGEWSWLMFAPPFVAVILLAAAFSVWRRGLNQYMSSGN